MYDRPRVSKSACTIAIKFYQFDIKIYFLPILCHILLIGNNIQINGRTKFKNTLWREQNNSLRILFGIFHYILLPAASLVAKKYIFI